MVYTNRSLNMANIKYIGFDMDQSLVQYKNNNFERTAHQVLVEKLVKEKNYPPAVLKFKMDAHRAIRGLVIDQARGNLLKINRYSSIKRSYHGRRRLSDSEQNKFYPSSYIDLKESSNYLTIDTAFTVALTSLYAQLVDLKDASSHRALPSYRDMAKDVMDILEAAHRTSLLKRLVAQNISHFIVKDPLVAQGLEGFKQHGKKVWLITNSDYAYADMLLKHTLDPFLQHHSNWQDVFEYTITSAEKPRFFYDSLPFLSIDTSTGKMDILNTPLKPGIYYGGSALTLTQQLKLHPHDILYIGDHIYGDIVRLKKDCGWRTALVVEEIESEVEKIKSAQPMTKKIDAMVQEKRKIEQQLERDFTATTLTREHVLQLQHKAGQLEEKIQAALHNVYDHFNPYWGPIMQSLNEDSYFAYQVERYACIYMPKITDFLLNSPYKYYHARRHKPPHEVAL